MQNFFTKIKTFLTDHWQLLFKSASVNHLRIQELLKNSDGTYQLTVKFGSYSELKAYQKKLRRLTVSLSSAVAMVIVAIVVAPFVMHPSRSSASTFLWTQTSWATHATDPDTTASQYPANNSGWAEYNSKNNVTASASGVTLPTPSVVSVQDTAYTGTPTGFYTSGNVLKLLKPIGAGCGTAGDAIGNGECATNYCSSNVCTMPPCNMITPGQTCTFGGVTYGVVTGADGRIWLDRNLGAPNVASTYNDSADYGWYYQWGRGTDGHQNPTVSPGSVLSTALISTCSIAETLPGSPFDGGDFITTSSGNYDWCSTQYNLWNCMTTNIASSGSCTGSDMNDPCPTGFHVPTQFEWANLVSKPFTGYPSGITGDTAAFASSLKLTAAGLRNIDGTLANQGSLGYYWSSAPYSTNAYGLVFISSGVYPAGNYYRVLGFSVRCVKN